MRKRKVLLILVPAILLTIILGIRHQIWQREHPPVTAADLKARRIIQNSIGLTVDSGSGPLLLSPAQKQVLIKHFWTTSEIIKPVYPAPIGTTFEFHLSLPRKTPGQGEIFLKPDVAESSFLTSHWNFYPEFDGSPPITENEEYFDIHPVTHRFLRAWIAAGMPENPHD